MLVYQSFTTPHSIRFLASFYKALFADFSEFTGIPLALNDIDHLDEWPFAQYV